MNLLIFLIRVELGIAMDSSGQQNAKLFLLPHKFTVVVYLNRMKCLFSVNRAKRWDDHRILVHNYIYYLGSPCHSYPLVHVINQF